MTLIDKLRAADGRIQGPLSALLTALEGESG